MRPVTTQVDDSVSEIRQRLAVGERVLVTTLTKRMAEQLTEFYSEAGLRVCATCTRTSIRWSAPRSFAICGRVSSMSLVGINLLREGLDLPEVSLVLILDADKEGFLRAERSLIQTCGRAAQRQRQGHHVRRSHHALDAVLPR